ncbi:hypothetical protein MSG28_015939 [Choristoneura fumiferana]|uniref:Uncharacterized protein n=2 Tax=Choristoneura fumiferana TaxID=7141 RepID=A0ACC0K594_CHOFU|nr:hypothetical protein MSG28_015939 [Choristoneura fumiferana]
MLRRAIKSIIKYYIFFLLSYCNAAEILTENTETVHLKNERIKDICGKINDICLTSNMPLCTVRVVKGKLQFMEFDNNCFLFLYNMCVYPGKEWAIKDVGSCKKQNLRRFAEEVEKAQPTNYNVSDLTTDGNTETLADDKTGVANVEKTPDTGLTGDNIGSTDNPVTAGDNTLVTNDNVESTTDVTEVMTDDTKQTTDDNTELANNETNISGDSESLKLGLRTPRTTYGVEQAPDGHNCPYHCPNVYSPVCVNVNRGEGKYYRLLFFVNHCEADRHYCLHWDTEYQPPPNEEYEMVRPPSNAAWSYCAGNK